jgi:hypothetical protein
MHTLVSVGQFLGACNQPYICHGAGGRSKVALLHQAVLRWSRIGIQNFQVDFLLLGVGIACLLLSFQIHVSSFAEVVEQSGLRTWAIFLIGLPCLEFVGRLLPQRDVRESEQERQFGRVQFSNVQWFLVTAIVFAALFLYSLFRWRSAS